MPANVLTHFTYRFSRLWRNKLVHMVCYKYMRMNPTSMLIRAFSDQIKDNLPITKVPNNVMATNSTRFGISDTKAREPVIVIEVSPIILTGRLR